MEAIVKLEFLHLGSCNFLCPIVKKNLETEIRDFFFFFNFIVWFSFYRCPAVDKCIQSTSAKSTFCNLKGQILQWIFCFTNVIQEPFKEAKKTVVKYKKDKGMINNIVKNKKNRLNIL